MQKKIILACTECLSRNYSSYKNAGSAERLQTNKFCKKCKRHTLHRETK